MQSQVSECGWGLQDVKEKDAKRGHKWDTGCELQREFHSGAKGVVRGLQERAE